MNDGIPERVRALIVDVVIAHNRGRAVSLLVNDAVVLREHGLVNMVNQPTELGFAIARYSMGWTGDAKNEKY